VLVAGNFFGLGFAEDVLEYFEEFFEHFSANFGICW
jgi:hypothetical protein